MFILLSKLGDKLSSSKTFRIIGSLLMLSLLFTVIVYNTPVWSPVLETILAAIKPFVFGLVIAYVLSPVINFLTKRGVNRLVAIFLTFVMLVLFGVIMLLVIIPVLFENTFLLISVLIDAFKDFDYFLSHDANQNNPVFVVLQEVMLQLNSIEITSKLSNLAASSTPTVINIAKSIVGSLVTTIFAVVIASYILLQKDKIKTGFKEIFKKISPNFPEYASQINVQMRIYIRAIGLVMLSKGPAYLTFYYFINHKNWLMLGILMIFTVLIPYLGPLIVNTIAIMTAFPQGSKVLLLTCLVVTYSMFIDTYIIDPKIYGHAVKLEPLAVIFAIFLGGAVFGIIGILLAIPALLIIRVSLNTRADITKKETV